MPIDKETEDRQTPGQTNIHTYILTDLHADIHIDRQTKRELPASEPIGVQHIFYRGAAAAEENGH